MVQFDKKGASMKRTLLALTLGLIFGLPAAFAQDTPNPIFSSALVAWTDMQTPQPVPEGTPRPAPPSPEPQPETRVNPNTPDSSTSPSAPGKADEGQGQAPMAAARTFTGVVGKEADTYVLKISGASSYKLDDQDQAKQFDGQRVSVQGILDEGSAVIHIQKIEPLT